MSCAGCDDCPRDRWHLHVTVAPHRSWSHADVVAALRSDIERHGVRPVVITNHLPDGRSYRELIPTQHVDGDEARAARRIFRLATLLNNAGWRVRRLKIEGDARLVPEGRALYYEAHIKTELPLNKPRSTNGRGQSIYTFRERALATIQFDYEHLPQLRDVPLRIEAAVLDTRPELDYEWIGWTR